MARLHVIERDKAQAVMDGLHVTLEKRLSVGSISPCPVEFTAAFIEMCATQSCGKCTPCRIGLEVLHELILDVLENRAGEETLDLIERVARTIYLSADCAIGYEAAAMALTAIEGFHDDFEHHVNEGHCGFEQSRYVPCVSGCPAGVDIPGYISLIEVGRYTDAVELIRRDNPLPTVCGLVCEHPCEMNCRRGMVDDPINIRGLKRYAVEHMERDFRTAVADATGKKIAVIGGGPAGLSAAYYLTLMGHSLTLFESRRNLGGMLHYGIPSYRLSKDVLDEEISWITDVGIEVKTEHAVGTSEFEKLRKDYDAVYIAIGAHEERKMGLEGEDAEGVISAVKMLRSIGDDDKPDFSDMNVTVIGGGNVAMDVARSAVRCNAKKVTVVYRRRIADMTAQDEEISGAQAECCEVLELHAPSRIQVANGKVTGLVVEPQIIGKFEHGRPAPRRADSGEQVIPCERVLVAIGQSVDSRPFEDAGMKTKRGTIITEKDGSVPGFPGVFCGGDCQSGPATVIRAIRAGKVAAGNIDNYLGFNHQITSDIDLPAAHFKDRGFCARCETTNREASTRTNDFEPIEFGLTDEETRQETSRCLRCDHFGYGAFRREGTIQW